MPKKSELGLKPIYTDESGELVKMVLHRGKYADDNIVAELALPGVDNYSETTRQRLMGYGYAKWLMDRVSGVDMGQAKLDAMSEYLDLLREDKWTKPRQAPTSRVTSVFEEAIAALKGISIPDAQKALKGYDKEAIAKMKANEAVVAKMAEIEQERAGSETQAGALDDLI